MTKALDVCSKLASALDTDDSEKQAAWRARIRHIFADVDGSDLIHCAKNRHSGLYAALVRREPSSMYTVRLRPNPTGQERMMDLGLVRDPGGLPGATDPDQTSCSPRTGPLDRGLDSAGRVADAGLLPLRRHS